MLMTRGSWSRNRRMCGVSTDASFDGQSGYLVPPSGTIPGSDTTPSVSVWFKTTTAAGILLSAALLGRVITVSTWFGWITEL